MSKKDQIKIYSSRKKEKPKNRITDKTDCRGYQMLNHQYIYGKLTEKDEEAFVAHIRQCADCNEELHSYFTFSTALSFLGDAEAVRDIPTDVEVLLRNTEKRHADSVKNDRILFVVSTVVGALLGVVLGILATGGI